MNRHDRLRDPWSANRSLCLWLGVPTLQRYRRKLHELTPDLTAASTHPQTQNKGTPLTQSSPYPGPP